MVTKTVDFPESQKITLRLKMKSLGRFRGLIGSAGDNLCQTPGLKSGLELVWRMFHLSLRLITVEGRLACLANDPHQPGRKTAIISHFFENLFPSIYPRPNTSTSPIFVDDVSGRAWLPRDQPCPDRWPIPVNWSVPANPLQKDHSQLPVGAYHM